MSKGNAVGMALQHFDAGTQVYYFEAHLQITREMLAELRLLEPHRQTLESWDEATFFARMSTLTAMVKAIRDLR